MLKLLPHAGPAILGAFVVVIVLTIVLSLVPPNKSPLYRIVASLFLIIVLVTIGFGVLSFTTAFIPQPMPHTTAAISH